MMNICEPINIIIAGVGGQGIGTLSKMIIGAAQKAEFPCKSAFYKGGAQTLGSVYSTIRIFPKEDKYRFFGSSIPSGSLNLLIGLEPWEALRFVEYCNSETKAFVSSEPIHIYGSNSLGDPIKQFDSYSFTSRFQPYKKIALSEYSDSRKAISLLLGDVIGANFFPLEMREYLVESADLPIS